jgi:hypothetical protein
LKSIVFSVVCAIVAMAAGAQEVWPADYLTAADQGRLERQGEARAKAAKQAELNGAADDIAVMKALLDSPRLETPPAAITLGAYRCRTIKVGGDLGNLTIYAWFNCVISRKDGTVFIEKTTGSQRFRGRLVETNDPTTLGWQGASHYGFEKTPRLYNSDPERNQVGTFHRLSPTRYVIELPEPAFESLYDLIELTKSR